MHRYTERANREKYFKANGINPEYVVTADSVHGAQTTVVSDKERGLIIAKTDSLITNSKNVFLAVTAADCFLLYFFDPLKEVIGLAHVGWRGLLNGVVENTIISLIKNFGVNSQNLLIGISPGIRQCHFEISSTDKEKFKEYSKFIFEKNDKTFISLSDIIKIKLLNKDVLTKHLEDSNVCTYCRDKEYFSYRRDHSEQTKVQVGFIGLSL